MHGGIAFGDAPADEDDETNASTCGGTRCEIDVSGCVLKCYTCGAGAGDKSPLTSRVALNRFGPYHPWHKYKKILDKITTRLVKVPQSYQCGICINTFQALGLNFEYGTLGHFHKAICQPAKREEGPKFVSATKNFIEQLNKHPERVRFKDKTELRQAFTFITTRDSMGEEDLGAEKEFVCLEHWDPEKDGKLDMTKVVEENWFGIWRKGCWRLKGREGVFSRKPKHMKMLEKSTELDDGQGPFAAKRVEKITNALGKVKEAAAKKV